MNRNFFLSVFFIVLCLVSCGGKDKSQSENRRAQEKAGAEYVNQARSMLEKGNAEEARKFIERLRKDYPLALNAREDAIILLDSVELFRLEQELKELDKEVEGDSVKNEQREEHFQSVCEQIKFYKRKLNHDRTNRKIH